MGLLASGLAENQTTNPRFRKRPCLMGVIEDPGCPFLVSIHKHFSPAPLPFFFKCSLSGKVTLSGEEHWQRHPYTQINLNS